MASWQTKSTKIVYENPWIIVHEDEVITPAGKDGIFGHIDFKGESVFVVPVDNEGNTYLVEQERYVTKLTGWEIPAGATDGQSFEEAAKRELLEEAGVQAAKVEVITEFYLANGIASFKGAVCLATGLEKVTDELDSADGILAARRLPLTKVRDMILSGEIVDGPTITAVLTTMAYLEKSSK